MRYVRGRPPHRRALLGGRPVATQVGLLAQAVQVTNDNGAWGYLGRRLLRMDWRRPEVRPHAECSDRIRRKDERLFAFAGLYDIWRHPNTGEVTRSCAIVTTTPNSSLEPVHNRMPAILSSEAEALWLDPLTQDPEPLGSLIQPYPDEELEHYPVEKTVNKARAQGPNLIERAAAQSSMPGLVTDSS